MSELEESTLEAERFPRASGYDPAWVMRGGFGANPLWLAEWLIEALALEPGMRVLDLGCGRAKSSIFLANEYDVSVWAADWWIDPAENLARIEDAGVGARVTPLRVDAHQLPFARGFFDAIVAIDAMQYFGTGDLFLNQLASLLRPDGRLGLASAGLMKPMEIPIPEHLSRFWTQDAWCLHTAQWWREHWARTQLVEVEVADSLEEGWRYWHRWAVATDASGWYQRMLREDAGEYLGYVRVVATRQGDVEPWVAPRPGDFSLAP